MRLGSMVNPINMSLVLTAAIMLGGACKEEDPLAFSTKVNEENICHEVAEVMCSNVFECCRGQQIEADFGVKLTTSEAECRTDMELHCKEQTAALRHSLSLGRSTLLAGQVEKCLEAYKVGEAGCFPRVSNFAAPCEQPMVRGNQAVGGKCLYSFECTGQAFCGADRKCQALPAEGESCDAGRACADGFFCDLLGEVPVCQPKRGIGDGCNPAAYTSYLIEECEGDAMCRTKTEEELAEDPELPGVCDEKKALGDSCENDAMCNSGKCLPGTCDGEGICFTDEHCVGTCRDDPSVTCNQDGHCYGTCQSSGATCNINNPCASTCSEGGWSCGADEDCWVCAVSGSNCVTDADCNGGIDTAGMDTATGAEVDDCLNNDICVEDDPCNITDVCEGAATCSGAVCGENFFTANYCTNSLVDSFALGTATTDSNAPEAK